MVTTTSRISKTPGVCGGEACIRTTRHTVSGLVEWKRLGLTDDQILEAHPDLSHDDLAAAWVYNSDHTAEIDEAIRENNEP